MERQRRAMGAVIAGAVFFLAVADSLKMATVAEGVETREQFAFLQALDCPTCQSHLFSPHWPRTRPRRSSDAWRTVSRACAEA